ncbi:MAG: hypothetical protein KF678_11100 [Phycisphaeraceae bacterium]|nr:hypothetical protein [Phycisphaeraceae bacterium]
MIEGASFSFKPSDGERGISEMLAVMAGLVKTANLRGIVDRIAGGISRDAAAAGISPLVGVYEFLRRHIVFKTDPWGTDQVTAPDTLLTRIAQTGQTSGDCDDVATLGASLVRALGFEPVFLVMGRPEFRDPVTNKVKLIHVFYGARVRGTIIPFDPQERIPPGQYPRDIGRLEVYEIFP